MPVTGRKPKPAGAAINRNTPTHEWAEIVDVPFDGPKMPKRPDGRRWHIRTRHWWTAISTMPHCVLWSPSDWDFAETTTLIAAEVHEGNWRAATELRNRERVLGTTVDYRRDLRIRYIAPMPEIVEAADEVVHLDDYRDL